MKEYRRNIFTYVFFGIIYLIADNISSLVWRSGITFLCCIMFILVEEYSKKTRGQESELFYVIELISKMKDIDEISINIITLLFGPCFQTIVIVGLTMLL